MRTLTATATLRANRRLGAWPRARARPSRERCSSTGNCSAAIRAAGADALQRCAGSATVTPLGNVARSAKAWSPQPSLLKLTGDAQVDQAPSSSWHCDAPPELTAKVSVAPVEANEPAPVGCAAAAVGRRTLAGDGSALPAASTARTDTIPLPAGTVAGEVHGVQAPSSNRHSKPPASVLENAAVPGPLMASAVSGLVWSTVQEKEAPSGSVWPQRSVACTRSTWSPGLTPCSTTCG